MMKKLYYFFLLLLLWGMGDLPSAWAQTVTLIGENFDTGAVTFTVNLSAATPTWVFVEYTTNPHNPASMSRATFTEVSAGILAADNRGFRLENSATVTAKLKDVSGMFSWCAYAISAPPRAKVNPGGGYTLHGTPPFTVNGAVLDEGVTNFGPGTCIESFTDFTYNPDAFLFDPPMTVTAMAPATVCAGAVTFTAIATGGTTTEMNYTWSIAGAEATTPDNPHITALATTGGDAYSTYTYTVFVTNANGCTSTVSEAGTLTVYAVPVVEDVSSATICSGITAALSATASNVTNPATYTWNIEGYSETWTTTNTYTTPALIATASTNLTYTVQITNSTGCMSEAAVGTVTVNPLPVPVFVSAPPSTVCPNSEATFTVSGAGDGGLYCFTYECTECVRNPFLTGKEVPPAVHCRWDSKCEFGTAETYSVMMPDAGSMTVWVQAMNEHSCISAVSAESTITVQESLTTPAGLTASPAIVCAGSPVTLTATDDNLDSDTVYEWGTGNIPGNNVIDGEEEEIYVINPTTTTTYWVRPKSTDVCPAKATVSVYAALNAGAIDAIVESICLGDEAANIIQSAAPSGGGGDYVYRWKHNDEVIPDANAETYTPAADDRNTPGVHTFTREVQSLCTPGEWLPSAHQGVLTVNDLPATPDDPSHVAFCDQGSATFSASVNDGETIDWYDALTGGNRVLEEQLSYTPASPLTATTSFYAEARNTTTGCVSAERLQVTTIVTPTPELTVEGVPGLACVGDVLTLQASGAFAGSSYCFSVYVDDQLHSDCEYGEANTFTVTVPAGTVTIWVRAKTIAGCEDDVLVHAPDMSSPDCTNSAGVITTNIPVTAILGHAPYVTIPANEEEAATANPTYEWRRTGTSSARLANSNTPAYTIADDIVAVNTAGTYYYHRWVYAGDPETSIALRADGSYTMVVVAPPPSPSGTSTWIKNNVIWSGALIDRSCTCDETHITTGCLYTHACAISTSPQLCVSPWIMPTSDMCSTLDPAWVSDWGYPTPMFENGSWVNTYGIQTPHKIGSYDYHTNLTPTTCATRAFVNVSDRVNSIMHIHCYANYTY